MAFCVMKVRLWTKASFKAVLIPYIVNLALDEAANSTLRQNLILFLRKKCRNVERKLDSVELIRKCIVTIIGDPYLLEILLLWAHKQVELLFWKVFSD